jgi:hypothetical protein
MAYIKNKNIFLFFVAILFCLPFFASASVTNGTIDSVYKYAWSNNIGWINFAPTGDSSSYKGLVVTDSTIAGYAWSNEHGWINFGPFVNNTQGGVKNTADGVLSGYAWGQELGWINFAGVSINSSGQFTGKATGDSVGIINFDLTKCTDCGVRTDWRPASVRPVATGGTSGSHGGRLFPVINTPPQTLPSDNIIPNTQPPLTNPTTISFATGKNSVNSSSTTQKPNPNTGQKITTLIPTTNTPANKPTSENKNTNAQISKTQKTGSSFFVKVGSLIQIIFNWFIGIIKSLWLFFTSFKF